MPPAPEFNTDDIEKSFKEHGIVDRTPPPATPSSSEGIIPSTAKSIGRGLSQGVLELGELGAPLGSLFPGDESFKKRKEIRKKFAEELKQFATPPSNESFGQSTVRNISALAPSGLFGWEFGGPIESSLLRMAQRAFGPVKKFVPTGQGMVSASTPRTALDRFIRYGATPAVTGGITGMMADPANPEKGAVEGAVAGAITRALGPFLRSNAAKWTAGHALPQTILAGLTHGAGFNWYASALTGLLASHTRWLSSPIGKKLRFTGERFVDDLGRTIGEVDTAKMRTAARVAAFKSGKIDPKMVALENMIGDFMKPALPAITGRAVSEELKDEER